MRECIRKTSAVSITEYRCISVHHLNLFSWSWETPLSSELFVKAVLSSLKVRGTGLRWKGNE